MGRRSQKSRSGQAKDRPKRAVKGSESTVRKPDKSDKSSVAEDDDSENDEDTADKSSDAHNADSKNDDDAIEKSPEAIDADSLEGVDTPEDSAANDTLDDESVDDIAAGYASIEADQSPQTRCPNCKTIFEVSPELLSSSDTRVRCGECLGIFDALASLRHLDDEGGDEFDSRATVDGMGNGGKRSDESDSRNESVDGAAANDISLDVTYADFSLFSADAALPEIDYLDETREVPAFDFDDPGGDDELDDTYSETLFAHGPEVDARSAINETDTGNAENDESTASDTPEEREGNTLSAGQTAVDDTTASIDATLSDSHTSDELDDLVGSLQQPAPIVSVDEKPVSSWWLRGALLLLVLTLAAGLYAYRERESLQHNQSVRPALETLCSVIGCTLAEPVDLGSLQVLKRSVFSHPKLNDVLVINIGFVNQASFNQRFPVLEIRLTDRNGGLVVKNSFEPSDYLDNWQPGDVLDTGKRLDISLNVKDPGNKAMSFELDFR